jgi:2-polyprenyl-6-methoxyphenol hydroxylase-like FAD-dependent oxidoreductase
MPQSKPRRIGGHAVVIGASMAGLLAARVVAEHFEKVTLLDRDTMPAGPEPRKCVPQDKHVHAMLKRGSDVLEKLFPGLEEELRQAGAVFSEMGRDGMWYQHGAWKPRLASGIFVPVLTRPLLEQHVRRRVLANPKVSLRQGVEVQGLVYDGALERMRGVRLAELGSRQEQVLEANLVVDASGRGSRSPLWLQELGYGEPREERVHIGFCYVTRMVRLPESLELDWKTMAIQPSAPEQTRIGYFFRVEGNQYISTLGGYHGDHPPLEEEGLLEFARGLPRPEYYEVLRHAEPVTKPVAFTVPYSRRYHYEEMKRFPAGYLVMGDAVCSFNPTFGQGMSVAAINAEILDQVLQAQGDRSLTLAHRFYRAAKPANDLAWLLAGSEDMRFPQTQAERPFGLAAIQWFTKQVVQMASTDEAVTRTFYRMVNMIEGPEALASPSILFKVALWSLGLRGGRTPVVDPPRLAPSPS